MANDSNPINVIIPMGGLGSRFSKNGYKLPKPLIPILGRSMISWILENLDVEKGDEIFIAIQKQVNEEYRISELINAEFAGMGIQFIYLEGLTRGAAETLYMVSKTFTEEQLKKRVISLDCDTIYFSNILGEFRKLDENEGCCAYFKDNGKKPIYSYISMNSPDDKKILDIAEKKLISRNANTGGYGFANGNVLNEYIIKLLETPVGEIGEFYSSSLIHLMIQDGFVFRGIHIERSDCVGTPVQLVNFFQSTLSRPDIVQPVSIVFDLGNSDSIDNISNWNDHDIVKHIGQQAADIHDKAKAIGLTVHLSFKSNIVIGPSDRFQFATQEQRETAGQQGRLFLVDDNIQKTVGWYL